MRWSVRILVALAGVAASAVVTDRLYRDHLRAWVVNWGASPEEVTRPLPGDELLDPADVVATRAITIDAPPSAIWPWLVQMGPGRAGAYTYDWIENLFGLRMHSADRIHPEWQDPEGRRPRPQPRGPTRHASGGPRPRADALEPVGGGGLGLDVRARPQDGRTRLISRNRIAMKGTAAGQRLGALVMEPGSLVMERKMLLGIKERAERLHAAQARQQP